MLTKAIHTKGLLDDDSCIVGRSVYHSRRNEESRRRRRWRQFPTHCDFPALLVDIIEEGLDTVILEMVLHWPVTYICLGAVAQDI